MPHILITGGAGFIGANFVEFYLDNHPDSQVTVLDKLTYAANEKTIEMHKSKYGNRYTFVQGDICDKNIVDQCVQNKSAIVHFAAESHVDRSVTHPEVFLQTNVLGTFTLLEAALKAGKIRFHHISTDEVFGSLSLDPNEKFTTETPYSPRSPYAASKAASDHIVRAYHETYGLPVTISNCTNNYGPYQFPEKVIPLFITRFMQGKLVPVYGPGTAVRDYVFVTDHCHAIDLILEKGKPGETYIVGGGEEKNTKQVAETILRELNMEDQYDTLVKHTTDRPGHDLRYAIDYSETTKKLGWKPSVTFEEGIRQTIAWYKTHDNWTAPIQHRAEEVAEKYLKLTT